MSDHPIIFSAPMVRALLDGRKTQTRRLAWREGETPFDLKPSPWQRVQPGDRLWVREAWARNYNQISDSHADTRLMYAADGVRAQDNGDEKPWRPSIHMPRWASRLTLTVTATKVERLHDITREDAIAEGLRLSSAEIEQFWRWPEPHHEHLWLSPRTAYRWLWEQLHDVDAWRANPEVVALTFAVDKRNIDATRQAA